MKLVKLEYAYINIEEIKYIKSSGDGNRGVIYFNDGTSMTSGLSLEEVVEKISAGEKADRESEYWRGYSDGVTAGAEGESLT